MTTKLNGSTGRTIAEVAEKERARAAAESTASAAADSASMTLAGAYEQQRVHYLNPRELEQQSEKQRRAEAAVAAQIQAQQERNAVVADANRKRARLERYEFVLRRVAAYLDPVVAILAAGDEDPSIGTDDRMGALEALLRVLETGREAAHINRLNEHAPAAPLIFTKCDEPTEDTIVVRLRKVDALRVTLGRRLFDLKRGLNYIPADVDTLDPLDQFVADGLVEIYPPGAKVPDGDDDEKPSAAEAARLAMLGAAQSRSS
jgi:hypothetical protein